LTPLASLNNKAKKTAKPKKPASHPKYGEMIAAALGALKERTVSSRQAILKYITANYKQVII
jgi:histone H1/5